MTNNQVRAIVRALALVSDNMQPWEHRTCRPPEMKDFEGILAEEGIEPDATVTKMRELLLRRPVQSADADVWRKWDRECSALLLPKGLQT